MGSGFIDNPKTWIPYMNTKDCSKKICSLYCPQWCYIIFPPPPPEENSSPKLSPHMIAIIGIVLSVFLLVIYYAIISKYFRKKGPPRRDENQNNPSVEMEIEENYQFSNPSNNEPLWYVVNNGLDECLIKSIRLCKFKKGDGLIEGTDCSICLNKFEEDESLRVLPKCGHAFHVNCIDTWLRSHSNCPLCRANIIVAEAAVNAEDRETHFGEEEIQERGGVVIEIREEEGGHQIRRSLSMEIVQ